MSHVVVLLMLKIGSLLGALAQTAGVVAFFAIPSLDPYKWHLVIGGTLLVAICELIVRWLAKRMAREDVDAGAQNTHTVGR